MMRRSGLGTTLRVHVYVCKAKYVYVGMWVWVDLSPVLGICPKCEILRQSFQ